MTLGRAGLRFFPAVRRQCAATVGALRRRATRCGRYVTRRLPKWTGAALTALLVAAVVAVGTRPRLGGEAQDPGAGAVATVWTAVDRRAAPAPWAVHIPLISDVGGAPPWPRIGPPELPDLAASTADESAAGVAGTRSGSRAAPSPDPALGAAVLGAALVVGAVVGTRRLGASHRSEAPGEESSAVAGQPPPAAEHPRREPVARRPTPRPTPVVERPRAGAGAEQPTDAPGPDEPGVGGVEIEQPAPRSGGSGTGDARTPSAATGATGDDGSSREPLPRAESSSRVVLFQKGTGQGWT